MGGAGQSLPGSFCLRLPASLLLLPEVSESDPADEIVAAVAESVARLSSPFLAGDRTTARATRVEWSDADRKMLARGKLLHGQSFSKMAADISLTFSNSIESSPNKTNRLKSYASSAVFKRFLQSSKLN